MPYIIYKHNHNKYLLIITIIMYLIVSYKNEIIINTYWLLIPTIIISFLIYIFLYKHNQNNCLLITIITIKFHIYTQNKREKIIFLR